MPFIVIHSVPVSFLGLLVSNLVVHIVAKRMFSKSEGDKRDIQTTDLTYFLKYTRTHLAVCLVLTLLGGGLLFYNAVEMIYSFKAIYIIEAFLLAAGPVIAFFLSTYVLIRLICKRGPRISNLFISGVIYLGMVFLCFVLGYLVETIPAMLLYPQESNT